VEPELYASLRPPVYQGTVPGVFGALGGAIGNTTGPGGQIGRGGNMQTGGQSNLGVGGGIQGGFGGGFGGIAGVPPGNGGPPIARPSVRSALGSRLSYEELLQRSEAARDGSKRTSGLVPTASADFGQSFRYDVAEPVSLPRFKSALLPVVSEPAEVARVSIYNPAALTNHPLLGVRLTNTSKQFLAQGPVAVYDAGTYAGDARLPDVKPGETRLLSYAIDLNTDAGTSPRENVNTTSSLKITAGRVKETIQHRRTTKYRFTNRSTDARTVLVTQPVEHDWKLTAPEQPTDRTADLYRFEVKLPGNGAATLDVVEERTTETEWTLYLLSDDVSDRLMKLPVASAAVKAALAKAKADRAAVAATENALAAEETALKAIIDGQGRLRDNITKVPKESETFQRYLKKFDDQETEIEQRQAKAAQLRADLKRQKESLRDAMEKVTAE
jgi:hypothetical protein